MTLSEKSAYLKGLMEGMKLDTETNEGKLISEIISMLQDVAENVSDLEEVVDCISDELDCGGGFAPARRSHQRFQESLRGA